MTLKAGVKAKLYRKYKSMGRATKDLNNDDPYWGTSTGQKE